MQEFKLSVARGLLPALSLFTAILIALLLFAALFTFSDNLLPSRLAPKAENGVIDLSNYSLQQSAPIKLDGEWHFYWQALLEPGQLPPLEKPMTMLLPASWNKSSNQGNSFPAFGYGTYQLTLNLATSGTPLAISLPEIGTAFRMYADQQLLASAGTVQPGEAGFAAEYAAQVVHFIPQSKRVTLTIQVANQAYSWGGIWYSIYLGEVGKVYELQAKESFRSIFLVGIFFIVAIYNLIQFSLRSADLFPFQFALMCLCLAIRELLSRSLLGLGIGLDLPFTLHLKVDYLTFSGAVLFFLGSLRTAFPKEFYGLVFWSITATSMLYSVIVIVTPAPFFANWLYIYQLTVFAGMLYSLYGVVLAIYRGRLGSKSFMFGMLILIISVVNDMLYVREIVHTGQMFGFGMVGMILCQCLMTYSRFIDAVNDKLRLSDELTKRNKQLTAFSHTLEDMVEERTQALEEANQKLAALANTDPLTELLNRRGMMTHIRQAMLEYSRNQRQFSLILLDVDHFKMINDRFGHDIGDSVLIWLAAQLEKDIREQDILARWGGEEFLIYLPGTHKAGAMQLAEKIRTQIAYAIPHADFDRGDITITMGVSEILDDESFEQCFSRADAALYRGKASGRDRVVAA